MGKVRFEESILSKKKIAILLLLLIPIFYLLFSSRLTAYFLADENQSSEQQIAENNPLETAQTEDNISISKIEENNVEVVINEDNQTSANETIIENQTQEVPANESIVIQNVTEISNITSGNVTEVESNATVYQIIKDETSQFPAVINEPVKWKRVIKTNKPAESIKFELPGEAENISIFKNENNQTIKISPEKIKMKENGIDVTDSKLTGMFYQKKQTDIIKLILDFLSYLFRLTGFFIYEDQKIEISIQDNVQEVEIEYYTEAPSAREEAISDLSKKVVISGPDDFAYENILAHASISPIVRDKKNLKLTWNKRDGTKEEMKFDVGFSENGFIDYIEWTAPFSGEEFEISILIEWSNVKSKSHKSTFDSIKSNGVPNDWYLKKQSDLKSVDDMQYNESSTEGFKIHNVHAEELKFYSPLIRWNGGNLNIVIQYKPIGTAECEQIAVFGAEVFFQDSSSDTSLSFMTDNFGRDNTPKISNDFYTTTKKMENGWYEMTAVSVLPIQSERLIRAFIAEPTLYCEEGFYIRYFSLW